MTNNDPLIGKTLRNEYTIEAMLGEGGMGAVYVARQKSLNRVVAIKVMHPHIARQSGFSERFTREAQTSALLEHPNIIPIYDYGQEDRYVYLVMRLLTGGSLEDRLNADSFGDKSLPTLSEVTPIIKQIASALDYAHNKGVIHRDMKPNNIMFDETGRPYLVDFGIAKLMTANSGLTGTGMAVGTPNFMPPEQWRGEPVTAATDQYALAVIVYHILAGKLPFEGDNHFAVMHKHLNELPTPLHQYRPDLHVAVMPILMKALAKNPQERFATCAEFVSSLELALGGYEGAPTNFFTMPLSVNSPNTPSANRGATPQKITSTAPKSSLWVGIFAIIGVLVVIGVVIVISSNGQSASGGEATATVSSVVLLPTYTLSPTPEPPPTETPTVDILTLIAQIDATNTAQYPLDQTATAEAIIFTPTPNITATIEAIMANRTATQVISANIATNIAQKATDQVFVDQTATQNAFAQIGQQSNADFLATQAALDAIATQIAIDATATATLWTPTPTLFPTHTPDGTVTPIIPPTIGRVVLSSAESTLKLREYPNLNATVLASLPDGASLMVTHRNQFADWLFVKYESADGLLVYGWVSAIFMDVTDENGNSVILLDRLPQLSEERAGYFSVVEMDLPTPTP